MKALAILVLLLAVPALVGANPQERDISSGSVGLKVGIIGGGDVDLGDAAFGGVPGKQATGFAIGGLVDFPAGEHLMYGASVDMFRMNWTADADERILDMSELLVDFGVNVKAVFASSNNRFAIRPGIGVGYGALKRFDQVNGSNYLTLRGFVEIIALATDGLPLVFEAGVWYAPSGGDANNDITIGPLLLVRVGVLLY